MKDPAQFAFGIALFIGSSILVAMAVVICWQSWSGKSLWSESNYDIGTVIPNEIPEEEATRWATNSLAIRDSTNVQSFRNWYRLDGRVMRFNPTNQTWYEIRKWKEDKE